VAAKVEGQAFGARLALGGAPQQPTRNRSWLINFRRVQPLPLVLMIVVAVATLVPLIYLVVNSFNVASPTSYKFTFGFGNWTSAYADGDTVRSIWTTVWLTLVRSGIAIPVGVLISWLIARTNMPGGTLVELGMWIAFSLPVLSLTLGWILLLDPKVGLVNEALAGLPFNHGLVLDIYSYWGIIWIHLFSRAIPILVILMTPAFRRVGARLEEVSRMCGASKFKTLVRVTAPVLLPTIAPLAILSIIGGLQSIDIELVVGIPARIFVFGTRIYDLLQQAPPEYGAATALGGSVLVVLLAMALLSNRIIRSREFTTVGADFSVAKVDLGRFRWVCFGACAVFLFIGVVIPTVSAILGSVMRRFGFFDLPHPFTTQHWSDVFGDPLFLASLRNSIALSVGSAVLAMVLYALVAHAALRSRGLPNRALDLLAWIPWGVPGILLSLALLWLFISTPLHVVLYGTLFGMMLAFVISSMPAGTQLAKAALIQIGHELEDASRMCGASGSRTAVQVLLPLMSPMLFTIGVLVFIGALSEFSQILLIYAPNSRPLSIMTLEYIFNGDLERAAVLGVFMTAIVSCLALGARWVGLKLGPR